MSSHAPDNPDQRSTGPQRHGAPPRLPLALYGIEAAGRHWQIEAVADEFVHFPFGLLLWDAAPVLACRIAEMAAEICGRRVLELGAGAGLAGIVAAALGAHVVQTDHAREALALAAANAARNGVDGIVRAQADWRHWPDLGKFDLIVGSDLLYDAELHAPLIGVLDACLSPGGRVLLSDPGRSTAPGFVAALRRRGWTTAERRRRVPALNPVRPGDTAVVTLVEAAR